MRTVDELIRDCMSVEAKYAFPFSEDAIKNLLYKARKEAIEETAKKFFYKGFEKCKNDDANCFTAWREEAPKLLSLINELK